MPRPSQPVPSEFAKYASVEGNLKLRKRFNVGGATIERWRAVIGARYNRPAMPKAIRTAVKKRIKARWQAQERIEDLDDGFDLGRCVASGGYGDW